MEQGKKIHKQTITPMVNRFLTKMQRKFKEDKVVFSANSASTLKNIKQHFNPNLASYAYINSKLFINITIRAKTIKLLE